jgi:ABC-type transporter Mla subunit MlaD
VDHGTEVLEHFNDFMKKQAEIEADYAKSMQKLVKQHKEDIVKKSQDKASSSFFTAYQNGTIHQAWIHMLDKTESIALSHQKLSDQIETSLRKTVKYRAKDNEKLKKERFDEIRKAVQELNKALDNLDRIRQKYDKAARDMEAAKLASDNLTKDSNAQKKDLDRLRTDYEKKTVIAHEQLQAYKQCIIETNQKKATHFRDFLPTQLDQVQKDDEELRIAFMQSALKKYHEIISSAQPDITDCLQSIGNALEQISPSYDSEFLAQMLGANDQYPVDCQLFESTVLVLNSQPRDQL